MDYRGLLAFLAAVALLVVVLLAIHRNRSPHARQGNRKEGIPSGAAPDDMDQRQASHKISRRGEQHQHLVSKRRKRYYDIIHDAHYWLWSVLCWLWRNSPDASKILAFATILLVVIGYWTLRDYEVTLERSERAWVGPVDVKIDAAPQKDKDVKITVSVRNTGKEPAIDVFHDINPFIVHKGEFSEVVGERAMSEYVDWCLSQPSRRRQQVLYPSSGFGAGFDYTNTIDKTLVDDALINGDDIILVRGCLVYSTFAKMRHSAFCSFYKEKVTDPAHLNLCVGGSDAD